MATQGVLGEATLKEFEQGLRGQMVAPGDRDYDEVRALYAAAVGRPVGGGREAPG